jgi:hypothetical protein
MASHSLLSSYMLNMVIFPNVPLNWVTTTSAEGKGSWHQLLVSMRL